MSVAASGTCQRCKRPVALDDGRHIAEHHNVWKVRCIGSGKLCAEHREANARMIRERTEAALLEIRATALVLHDSLEEAVAVLIRNWLARLR